MAEDTNTPQNQPAEPERPAQDLVADRRKKLARLRDELHIDPYGHREADLIPLADARQRYDAGADEAHKADPAQDRRPRVKVTGRIMLHRVMGNLIFLTLRDHSGDLQIAVSKKAVGPEAFALAKLADLGDLAVAEGPLATTKTGEITLWAESRDASNDACGLAGFRIASKSLAPPPGKFHGLTDPELRYRKRYVDLYANPEVMRLMQTRIRIVEEIRAYFRGHGFLEVETPMLQPIHGGAAARPFTTHHNALDMRLYLRIAPELYLKRLLVGGLPKVFEINRNFRNEGISPRHNPEFTMLEAYEAFGNWETMADLVEDLICTVAEKVHGSLIIQHKNEAGEVTKTINLTRPWRRVRMTDLVQEHTGWQFRKGRLEHEAPELVVRLAELMIHGRSIVPHPAGGFRVISDTSVTPPQSQEEFERRKDAVAEHIASLSPAEQLVDVYEKMVEPALIDPCFVTHVPSVIIPLAKENKDDPFFADVYELAINGVEISPGYTELNDPDAQERHFRHQVGDREEQQQVDEDFLEALRVGMPPAGGIGLGIDRLVMLLTGAESIRDVILFPLMRPQS